MSFTLEVEEKAATTGEIELEVEEIEEVIAPGIWENHNETLISDSEEIENRC